MRMSYSPTAHDRGQVAVGVTLIGAAFFVLLMSALSHLGGLMIDRVQAQTAADAAALASLDGGRSKADELAHVHGAIVILWQRGPGRDEVTVIVQVGEATATARATDAP